MTFREWREQVTAAKTEMQFARERLGAALQTMDYAVALACQIQLNELEREAHQLELRRNPYRGRIDIR